MEATFLLGAGVSMAVKMPSTQAVTDAVISDPGAHFYRHTDEQYLYAPQGVQEFDPYSGTGNINQDRTKVQLFQRFLGFLKTSIEQVRAATAFPRVTYEDVFYVAQAIAPAIRGKSSDPMAIEYWRHLREALEKGLEEGIKAELQGDRDALMIYGRGAVAAFLNAHAPRDLHCLDALAQVCSDPEVERVHFFTLNHDTVLEGLLNSQGIGFFDGLREPDGEVRWLDPSGYAGSSKKVLVYKLHGSVDWRFWVPSVQGISVARIGSGPGWPVDGGGTHYEPADPSPLVVVGTLNKAADYQWRPFRTLVGLFVECLERTDRLIVCGYGFGDRFIDGHLVDWLKINKAPRLVVVHHDDELEPRLSARGIGTPHVFGQGIERVTWQPLKECLSPR